MDSEALLRDCIVKVCGVPPGDVQADTELDARTVGDVARQLDAALAGPPGPAG